MESIDPFVMALSLGYLMDLALGDPEWIPHPVRFFGMLINRGERILNKGRYRVIKGGVFSILLITGVFAAFHVIENSLLTENIWVKTLFDGAFVYLGIANQTLIREVRKVFECLKQGLEKGRKQVSRIVGRDTDNLNEQEIKNAGLESLSENLSDGVIAPLFFYAILGVPGIMAYKMANTLDSMVGYRNERFEKFGKFSAKFDDLLNFIPARVTVLLMATASLNRNAIRFALKYGDKHKSPNAGYPEAALAGILNCRFGGPNFYKGVLVEKPFIGKNEKEIDQQDLMKAIRINHLSTLILVLVIIVVKVIVQW